MATRRLKSFEFEVGNSNKGALGMSLRVRAHTRQGAVDKANHFLGPIRPLEVTRGSYRTRIEYCTIYFGANLKFRQIARGQEIEEVSSDLARAIEETCDE